MLEFARDFNRFGVNDGFTVPVGRSARGNAFDRKPRAQPLPDRRHEQQKSGEVAEKARNKEEKPRDGTRHGFARNTLLEGGCLNGRAQRPGQARPGGPDQADAEDTPRQYQEKRRNHAQGVADHDDGGKFGGKPGEHQER